MLPVPRPPALGAVPRILVVGTGPAGLAAAEEARRLGFRGRLTMLGEEAGGPYDRPACSKGLLTGRQRPRDAQLAVPAWLDLDWQLGQRAAHLDLARRVVTAESGQRYGFDGLVIATGSRPVPPHEWPVGEPGLHFLHSMSDAWALRRDLRAARRVAIVGGGLTGCEVASAVRSMAREAVIIDSRRELMNRAIGEPVGMLVTEAHRASGVDLRLGRRVSGLDNRRGRWRVSLDDGDTVYADLVVVTTGERPDTDWLSGSGLDTSDGVLCDASLRVVGAPGVVAAGALARWPNLWLGAQPTRCGQWIAAMEQGRGAARTLLAGERVTPAVTLLPRFWSHQLDLRIQVCGEPDPDAYVEITSMSGQPTARSGMLASYYRGGQLVGLVGVNAATTFTPTARAMLASQSQRESVAVAIPAARRAPAPTIHRHQVVELAG